MGLAEEMEDPFGLILERTLHRRCVALGATLEDNEPEAGDEPTCRHKAVAV